MRRLIAAAAIAVTGTIGLALPASASPPSGEGQNNPKCSGTWDQDTKTCTIEEPYNNGNTKTKGEVYEKDGDPTLECKVNPSGKEICS